MTSIIKASQSPSLFWCGLILVGWIAVVLCQRSVTTPAFRRVLYVPRITLAFAFFLFAVRAIGRFTETSTQRPLWQIALSAAVVSEIALFCYRSEQPSHQSGQSSAARTLLPLLRVANIALLSMLLVGPVLTRVEEHDETHSVAVLVDLSDSMTLTARQKDHPDKSRIRLANDLLLGAAGDEGGLLSRLEQDYQVRLYQFGSTSREVNARAMRDSMTAADNRTPGSMNWTDSTDIAEGLRRMRHELSPKTLSGIVLLSDGCDHSGADLQEQCQSLGIGDIPVNTVVIGSRTPLKDAVVVNVQAPSQIYYGDSVSLTASIHLTQYPNETVAVRLLDGEDLIEERSIAVANNDHRETVTFRHQPERPGLHDYRVEIADLPHEESVHNNSVTKPVWVSRDRIRVLLVDERPRWEFRYLRNLFAGRDKTVFLQAVLLQPDRLAGVPLPPVMRASAERAFDDCDANALPLDEAEWFKFDVIVLGDIAANDLGESGIRTVARFVKDHGGTLIVMAGPNHMPHAYRATPLADVLPVLMTRPAITAAHSPDESFYFSPTIEGISHSVLQRSTNELSPSYQSFPELTWRHPYSEAKVGAGVLAYASRTRETPGIAGIDSAEQRRRALMLWHRFGAGKVLQVNIDETWRLRYGIGDRFHHEFWGQVIRWSVSERLSAGTDLVRLGIDQTVYKSDEPVSIKARLLNTDRSPVIDAPVRADILFADEVVQTVDLAPHPDGAGFWHGQVRNLARPGKYRIELSGDVVDQLLALETVGTQKVGLDFGVVATGENSELLDLVSDDTIPLQIADWTGGIVTDPANADSVLDHLGPKSTFTRNRWTVPLWNLWPIIALFLSGLSAEWYLRKVTGRI